METGLVSTVAQFYLQVKHMFLCELIKGVEKFTLPLSLLNCAPCAPSSLRALPIIDTHFARLCAFILINKPLTRIFLSCVVLFQS